MDQDVWNLFLSDWLVWFPNRSNMQEPSHVLHMNIFVVSKMAKLEAEHVVYRLLTQSSNPQEVDAKD